MKINTQTQIERAQSSLDRKLDWVSRHDARIAFVAGISIAMLGVLANAAASITEWSSVLYVIFGLAAALLTLGLILIYCSQYPKTNARNSSLIFFGTIGSLKCDEYKKRFKERTDEEHLDDLLYQIHTNAEILTKKFSFLKWAMISMALAIIPWVFGLYLSKFYLK